MNVIQEHIRDSLDFDKVQMNPKIPRAAELNTYLSFDVVARFAALVGVFVIVYSIGLICYRLLLSPIAKFPGPKLAAVSGWYEVYYDVVKRGKYLFEIEKMHEKYGPIVRINPHELSIRDRDYTDELYVAGSVRPTDRYEGFTKGVVDFDGSHLATIQHDLHRRRRKPLDPFFSRQGIQKLEPMVGDLVERLLGRFESFKGTGKIVRLDHAFTAFSGDIINRICVDDPPNFIDTPDFAPEWFDLFHMGAVSLPLFMGMPWLIHVIRLIPDSLLAKLGPGSSNFNRFKVMCDAQLQTVKREKAAAGGKITAKADGSQRLTLFKHLMNSDLPASELSDERLSREAQVLIGAGTITTAGTMIFICYYIMANPSMKAKLQDELRPLFTEYPQKKPTWAQLEKLPYFQGIIKEGLRLSYGTLHRRSRVSPNKDLRFKQWIIPKGTPVGMSSYYQHRDAETFPEPEKFLPERWIGNVSNQMQRNYIPFSRGSRYCLGQNLAYCEINFVIATLFRPNGPEFRLFETGEMDVKPIHDLIIPLPSLQSKGFRVQFI